MGGEWWIRNFQMCSENRRFPFVLPYRSESINPTIHYHFVCIWLWICVVIIVRHAAFTHSLLPIGNIYAIFVGNFHFAWWITYLRARRGLKTIRWLPLRRGNSISSIHYLSNIINYMFTHGWIGSTTVAAAEAARRGKKKKKRFACEYHNYCTYLMIIALDSV